MSSPIPGTIYSVHGIAEMAPRPVKVAGAAGDGVSGDGAKDSHPLFGQDGFTFSDFLDIINPLQHIPIVNTVYRAITGDKIDPGARIVGGGLFGGPIGLVASLASGMVQEATGKDPGEHVMAALGINLGSTDQPTMLAEAGAAETAISQTPNIQAVQPQTVPQPANQEMKLGVTMDPPAETRRARTAAGQPVASNGGGAVELPADLFQALKQTAATQQADARATTINAARANPLPGQQPRPHMAGPMQVNAGPGQAVQGADGRTWFPAFPAGGGTVPVRAVGTTPVTPAAAATKFGVARGNNYMAPPQAATASTAAMLQGEGQAEWSNRAADAYQKYYEMQNEKNRRAGIVP